MALWLTNGWAEKRLQWSGCSLACDHRFKGVDHVPTNNWGFVWEIGSIIVICILWALKTAVVSHITASPQSFIWALQQVRVSSKYSITIVITLAFCTLFASMPPNLLSTSKCSGGRVKVLCDIFRILLLCSVHQVLDICIVEPSG